MNQVHDLPPEREFGLDFDYSAWTPNTHITLTQVPWEATYQNVVHFPTTDDLNKYIDQSTSRNVNITNSSYAKVNQPISIDLPFNQAYRFNYVRVYNPAQPVPGNDFAKYFYYFITDVKYVAPNTSLITVQLDVWQTFIRFATFGRCYVERGHLGIANKDNFRNYGRDYLTVPEGLDTGANYFPVMRRGDDQVILPGANKYSILVASTRKLEGAAGTVDKPLFSSAEGGVTQGLPSGASYYIFQTAFDFESFMRAFSDKPWVTSGIISITVIPPITRYYDASALGAKLSIGAYKAPRVAAYKTAENLAPNWRDSAQILSYIPVRYRHLKKLLTFPYMAIELTTLTGQSSILNPELWYSRDAMIAEEVALLPPNQRLSWYPRGYNAGQEPNPVSQDNGTGVDHAASLSNLPALAIVNDGAILAMANSASGIAFGYQSADWSQQRALRSNEVSYDQATQGIGAAGAQTNNTLAQSRAALGLNNQVTGQQAVQSSVGGLVTGAGMGALVGGPAGAVVGAVGGLGAGIIGNIGSLSQQNANTQQYGIQSMGLRGAAGIDEGLATGIRDSNKALGDFAARGDYENTIAGLNARTRDMQLSAPSIAGQVGGEALGMLNFRFGYQLRWLMPDQASLNTVGEYWLRFGYAVQRFSFLPPSLMVMDKFTYWKLKETHIRSAAMPEMYKQTLRGILEKGVTVYARPDDIGWIDPAENKPLPNIVIDGYVPPDPTPDPEPEPPVTKKKRKVNMITISAIDTNPATPGPVWALAGTSPGTDANFLETRDPIRGAAYATACGVDSPIGVTMIEFAEMRDLYKAPISTIEVPVIL